VAWLLGEAVTRAAAKDFVRWLPPVAPCIADYAESFPDLLARRADLEHIPYLRWFARLDWHLGEVAVAVDEPPLEIGTLASFEPDAIPDLILNVQGGLRFVAAPWPVDDVMKVYFTEDRAVRLLLHAAPVWLQILGARGRFRTERLDQATFAFRSAVARGQPLGTAAEQALELDPTFDPGAALTALLACGLATSVTRGCQGEQP
jgi:hypothetical protein